MKKLFVLASLLIGMIAGAMMLSSFTGNEMTGDNSCTVTVYYNNGSVASSVKVTTEVSGGVSCMGGRDFYTDDKGVVTLKWSDGCYLKKVYVKGDGYDVDYKNGKNYTLTLKR